MNFSAAIRELMAGRRIRLNYWAKGSYLELKDNEEWIREPTIFHTLCRTNGKDSPTERVRWSPHQCDLLSSNWELA